MPETDTTSCTVGMLAWNSGDTLARTLENVRNFAEVIIADGGSTDDTLAIAAKYGARVIPQTNPGHPITDFSKERNLLLDASTQPWFLWLDSDELLTDDLREEIRAVCINFEKGSLDEISQREKPVAYRLRIARCDPKTLRPYIDLKANYQTRLIRTDIGARYVNAIHEHLNYDTVAHTTGTLKGAWLVPLNRLDFTSYKREVDKRFPALVQGKPPRTLSAYIKKGVLRPLLAIIKILVRVVTLRILHPFGHVVPLVIERGRLYTQWVIMRESWRAYRMAGQLHL